MDYNEEVKELLESYHDKIEVEVMPHLTEDFTKFYNGLAELTLKFKSKGLLKEDPYLKGSEIIEIIVPDATPFSESDAQWKVAERITQFEAILSFITHNYNFSLNTFNFAELEKLKHFLDYYEWKGLLNPTTQALNTRSLGKIALNFKSLTDDKMVLSTLDKCVEVIIKSNDSILNKLKFILLYLKESYKMFIRIDLLPIVVEKHSDATESKMLEFIRSEIKENYSYLKFYKKYVIEVIKEEFSTEKEELKKSVIQKLTITKKSETKEKKVEIKDPKKDLVKLLLEIGKIRIHIAASIEKIFTSHNYLNTKSGNFMSKILRAIARALFNIDHKTMYDLTIKKKTSSTKMTLHFENFYEDIKKLEFDLLNFAEEDKTQMYISSENNITKNIDRLLMNIKKNVTIFIALDEYLKTELRNKNMKAKGIKPELNVIKSLINSSTALYRDYLDNIKK